MHGQVNQSLKKRKLVRGNNLQDPDVPDHWFAAVDQGEKTDAEKPEGQVPGNPVPGLIGKNKVGRVEAHGQFSCGLYKNKELAPGKPAFGHFVDERLFPADKRQIPEFKTAGKAAVAEWGTGPVVERICRQGHFL